MHRNTWKAHERKIAKYFGTTRNPLSGGNAKHSRSDSLHPSIYFELKSGKQVVNMSWKKIGELFADTETKADFEHKFPVVVLKPAGTAAPVSHWTCYFRVSDGCFHETLVAAPLWVIKEAYDEGHIEGLLEKKWAIRFSGNSQ